MLLPKTLLVLAVCSFGLGLSHAKDYQSGALIGDWKCGPYTMVGEGFETTATEMTSYQPDGSYKSTSDLTVQLQSGKVVKTRDQAFGSWNLDGHIIEVRYNKAEFLWSDDPTYTVEMGQRDADAQLKKKSWSKAKVLELNEKLITLPVESMYKGAEIAVTCVRSSKRNG